MRVASLVPSATETLLEWGVVPVAVTRWCGHPELPQAGGTKDPDLDVIRALQPDLVVMCEEENRREDHAALAAAGVDTHVLRIRSVADVGPELTALASRLGVADRWRPPVAGDVAATRSAFVPIWREGRGAVYTTISADTYGASLLAALGVVTAFADAEDRYPRTTLRDAAARRPDLVLAPSEPYPFGARHVAELSAVAPVTLCDGQDLFWWGARTGAALSRLGALLGVAEGGEGCD